MNEKRPILLVLAFITAIFLSDYLVCMYLHKEIFKSNNNQEISQSFISKEQHDYNILK